MSDKIISGDILWCLWQDVERCAQNQVGEEKGASLWWLGHWGGKLADHGGEHCRPSWRLRCWRPPWKLLRSPSRLSWWHERSQEVHGKLCEAHQTRRNLHHWSQVCCHDTLSVTYNLMINVLSETMITFWPMEKLLPRISITTAITLMTSRPASSTSTTSPTSSHWTTSWMWIRRTQTATSSGKSNRWHKMTRIIFQHVWWFRLSYYPHTLDSFSALLKEAFGKNAKHTVYADFKPLKDEPEPSFYIHVIEKPM